MRQVDETLARFERYQAPLDNLDHLQQTLKNDINSVVRLLQAYQEFSQSQNHDVAYQYAHSLLSDQAVQPGQSEIGREILDNPVALYIAGWLEVHHISGKLDEGIEHLKKATQLEPGWATVQAAYGVGLRRKAIRTKDATLKRELYNAAETELVIALKRSPSLTDFNKESFHGPLGGIYRDTNRLEEAIKEYQEALRITPGSSYPKGNLASLYLWQASHDHDDAMLQRALESFEDTYEAARSELREAPGNYFLLMDLSMSMMVLGHDNMENTQRANRHLEEALHVEAACTMLEVSLGGWQRLLTYCPGTDEWKATRDQIQNAIARVQEQMEIVGCLELIT
jgi:tetratricopeptide (TPR) repeat protein